MQEMISDSMFHYIATLSEDASEDSFIHAVVNWIALGSYTGFQKSEFCLDHHDTFATINNPYWGNHLKGTARHRQRLRICCRVWKPNT